MLLVAATGWLSTTILPLWADKKWGANIYAMIHSNDLLKEHGQDTINSFFASIVLLAIDLPDLLLQLCIQLHTSCYIYQLTSVTRSLAIHTCKENSEGYIGAVMDIASVGLT